MRSILRDDVPLIIINILERVQMGRIIYAEDDELTGELLTKILTNAGHAVGGLKNGQETLAALRFLAPELVILDQKMPILGGSAVLRKCAKAGIGNGAGLNAYRGKGAGRPRYRVFLGRRLLSHKTL